MTATNVDQVWDNETARQLSPPGRYTLLDGRSFGEGSARLSVRMDPGAPTAYGVVVAVKWTQEGATHGCVILSAHVPEDGGLRP